MNPVTRMCDFCDCKDCSAQPSAFTDHPLMQGGGHVSIDNIDNFEKPDHGHAAALRAGPVDKMWLPWTASTKKGKRICLCCALSNKVIVDSRFYRATELLESLLR